MLKVFISYILFLVIAPLHLQAQSSYAIDSVLLTRKAEFYIKGAKAYMSNKLDSSLYYFTQELRYAREIPDSSGIMRAYSHISMVYWRQDEYRNAAQIYSMVYQMASEHKDTSEMATAVQNLGNYEVKRQDYTKAVERYEEAYRLSSEIEDHLSSMYILESVFSLYLFDLNNLPQAYRAVEEMKEVLGKLREDDVYPGTVIYHRSLMNYHDRAGQHRDAVTENAHLLALYASGAKDVPLAYISAYIRRVMLLQNLEDKEWAYAACDTLSLLAETVNTDKTRADIRYTIATAYLNYGDYGQARTEFENAYRIFSLQGITSKCITILKYLANIHLIEREYPAAREVMDKAIALCSDDHPNMKCTLLAMRSGLSLKEKDMASVWKDCHELLRSEKLIIKNNIRKLTEQEREMYWEEAGARIFGYAAMGVKSSAWNNEFTGDIYDALLFSKGLLLNSGAQVHAVVERSEDASIKAMYAQYLSLLSQSEFLHGDSQMSAVADSLRWRADDLYREVMDAVDYYGGYTAFLDVDWHQVQEALGSEDAAVEFMDFQVDSTVQYAAAVLRKGWKYPQLVPLCTAADLKPFISNKDGYEFYSPKNVDGLYRLLLSPLAPYLPSEGTAFFSPAGVLHKINLDALAQGQYHFKRLSSTRELCTTIIAEPLTSAVLFGGLRYSGEWTSIPGASKEVEKVEAIISEANPKVDIELYEGLEGSRERFLSLSGSLGGILHLSTHGFFMERDSSQVNLFAEAMRRSGLVLSGGDILGSEIANMNLKGTSLVVLSACETGLGDVSSEGVFGLQRAFKKAGARTVIMSLWKVSDKATFLLMSQFYSNLILKKQNKDLAFANAKESVRRKFEEPYYWAGFVMLD